jgi:hypothetical protein
VAAVAERGLRPVAREIGCAVNWLAMFVDGSTPVRRTVRRLRHWLVRSGEGSDEDALEVLLERVPVAEREEVRRWVLAALKPRG